MRSSLRRLAAVKPGRYLEPGAPTGLTGLHTHPAPRSHLLYLYGSILEKLQAFPESSVYRQSTEALTKHRMNIIAQLKPPGFDEWQKRAAEKIEKHPDLFAPGNPSRTKFFENDANQSKDDLEWEGENPLPTMEGPKDEKAAAFNAAQLSGEIPLPGDNVDWEPEPALEASQISEAETQIGAGLIEEIVQVAKGELELVDSMMKNKVWEELEEKPPAGQWDYFARDQHTPGTQEPPSK